MPPLSRAGGFNDSERVLGGENVQGRAELDSDTDPSIEMERTSVMTVRTAGHAWRLDIDGEEGREALAEWFGPWASAASAHPSTDAADAGAGARDDACAGFVTMRAVAEDQVRRPHPLASERTQDESGPIAPAKVRAVWNEAAGSFFEHTVEGVRAGCDEFEITITARDGKDCVAVVYVNGSERRAARAVFRLLATRRVLADGGVVLHSSSVKTERGLLVFAGPSGAGKTTAAFTFPPEVRLDPDLVLLVERDGHWCRLDHFDEYEPYRFAPGVAAGLPVRAVLLPSAGPGFSIRFLKGAEAVAACLHVPPPSVFGDAPMETGEAISRAERFARAVPVARFAWSLAREEDDLPKLLDDALG